MILVAGCSYCDQYHNDYPLWPYLLNREVLNIARSGYSNQQIYESVINFIINDYVLPSNTSFSKFDQYSNQNTVELCILSWTEWHREGTYDDISKQTNSRTLSDERILELVDISLQSIDKTNKLLQVNDIPVISVQMLPPLRSTIIKNNKDKLIDKINKYDDLFIGYPGIEEFGGFSLYNELKLYDHLREDSHPNKKGNEIIADTIYKYINGNTCLSSTEN